MQAEIVESTSAVLHFQLATTILTPLCAELRWGVKKNEIYVYVYICIPYHCLTLRWCEWLWYKYLFRIGVIPPNRNVKCSWYSLSWFRVMTWWRTEPWDQQAWYWSSWPGILWLLTLTVKCNHCKHLADVIIITMMALTYPEICYVDQSVCDMFVCCNITVISYTYWFITKSSFRL